MDKYKVVALIGKSGAGKDFIKNTLISINPDIFVPVVTYTTRPPRIGEIDGINYHFISENNFARLIYEDQMLEYTQFREWHYGTSVQGLNKEKINICVLNPAGVESLRKKDNVNLIVIKILATSKTRLMRTLKREKNPDCYEICRRFLADEEDFKKMISIDYLFSNDELEASEKDFIQLKENILKTYKSREEAAKR